MRWPPVVEAHVASGVARARTDWSSGRAQRAKRVGVEGGGRDDERVVVAREIARDRARIGGIVVPCEELADERVPVACGGGGIPALDRLAPVQRNEMRETRRQSVAGSAR